MKEALTELLSFAVAVTLTLPGLLNVSLPAEETDAMALSLTDQVTRLDASFGSVAALSVMDGRASISTAKVVPLIFLPASSLILTEVGLGSAVIVKGTLVATPGARIVLAGVVGSLLGIAFVGLAGKFKEGDLSEEQKKAAVAEFDFKKGMLVALFSGIASAGMNFGLQSGAALEAAAKDAGTPAAWCGMPVLVVVLWGGLVVNVAWCLWQNRKNGTFGDYGRMFGGNFAAIVLASLAGVIWACQFACQKVGEPQMGDLKYIGFAVVMGSSIFFSSLLGLLMGEWKGTGAKTKGCLALGIIVLLVSFCVISYGSK